MSQFGRYGMIIETTQVKGGTTKTAYNYHVTVFLDKPLYIKATDSKQPQQADFPWQKSLLILS
jgi:hypothetical protein